MFQGDQERYRWRKYAHLDFVATLPASPPFLIIADWTVALRMSNTVTIIMMFVVGYHWARSYGCNEGRFAGKTP